MIVALVNTTGTSQRPITEVVPLTDVTIDIPLSGRGFISGKALWNDTVSVRADGEVVRIVVGKLEEFASVELSLQ